MWAHVVALLVPSLLAPGLLAQAEGGNERFTEDFSTYAPGSDGSPRWVPQSLFWEVRDGAYAFDGRAPGFSVAGEPPNFGRLTVEATLTVREGHGDSWKVAGIAAYADGANFWHLALVEAPDGRHYVELAEMLNGAWLAQTKLRATVLDGPMADAWEYDTPYRLRIALTPEGIDGTIARPDGAVTHRLGYAFSGEAVTAGRPALRASMLSGAFDGVEASMSDPVPLPPAPERPRFAVRADSRKIGEGTGFYRVQEADGVWWVVDPAGNRFYAVGTDHCRMSGHWCEKLGYAPYGRNMEVRFASPTAWAESATERLKAWNFNTLGAGGGEEAFYRGLTHTQFVAFGSTFSGISDLCPKTTWTGFPNVFHPKWERYCDQMAREACARHRDDPWLFGYFLDNELEWYGKTGQVWGLFAETMRKPRDHSGKSALVRFLRDRYETIERFNTAWRTGYRSFDELLDVEALDGSPPEAQRATVDFVREVADRYFAVTSAAIRKHDPNHMVIGCRFAGDAPAGIWDVAGKYCDIVTFNYYGNVDLETGEAPGLAERFTDYYRQAQRPLMITEWSYPALDSGLPCKHGAGQRFDTQAQRAQAYEIFQRMVFSLPFMVGSDYFMWVDEPALGISSTFPEDTNYGLVDEQDEPYPELTATATRVNALAYDLHEAGLAEVSLGPVRVGDRGYETSIANQGRGPVAVDVKTVVDGAESRRTVDVPAGGRERLRGEVAWLPGGHLVVVEADPDRKLSEASRADDRAAHCFLRPGVRPPASLPTGTRCFPLAVGNAGDEALVGLPVSRRLAGIADWDWEAVEAPQVCVYRAGDGQLVTCQIDPMGAGLVGDSELSFVVAELKPRSCETYLVCVLPASPGQPRASSLAHAEASGEAFSLESGGLSLSRVAGSGNIVDTIALKGTVLGSYNPLIWQHPGQSQWVRANRGGPLELSLGPVRARLRVTSAYEPDAGARPITAVDQTGRQAPQQGVPVPFRVTHELVVYPGRPWFHARLSSIENTGDRPLQVNGYFFYLNSALGGSPAGDVPATPDVPNYYAGGQGAWRDASAAEVLGAEPWPGSDLQVTFFVDEGGLQHPDARVQFAQPLVLQPGETYSPADAPVLTVYAATGETRPWRAVQAQLRAWADGVIAVGGAERR
jgi:agarase